MKAYFKLTIYLESISDSKKEYIFEQKDIKINSNIFKLYTLRSIRHTQPLDCKKTKGKSYRLTTKV